MYYNLIRRKVEYRIDEEFSKNSNIINSGLKFSRWFCRGTKNNGIAFGEVGSSIKVLGLSN